MKIHRIGDDGEPQTTEVKAHVGPTMLLPIKTDVEEGDLVEYDLPSGKSRTVELTRVVHHQSPTAGGRLNHIEAEYAPVSRPQPLVRPTFDLPGLHPTISAASGALYRDGHYRQAVREAFQVVEHRVQKLSGRQDTGTSLMGAVFSGATPTLDITRATGRNALDEREGFKLLFMGAMLGLKNPRGHGTALVDTADDAMESLAFASLLMRRLDLAEQRLQ